jgi:Cu+-exporting ATPase
MSVVRIEPDDPELLPLAAAVETASEHPVARAVVAAAGTGIPVVDDFAALPGLGARGLVEGHRVTVGHLDLFDDVPADVRRSVGAVGDGTPVVVGWDGVARGVVTVADTVRPSSAEAVAALHRLGLRTVLLTGDHAVPAQRVAAEVGIEAVVADVRPEGKVAEVFRLQEAGRVVAMVGDGVNDAAALAQADLGLAMGTGTDVAMAASDLTLVRGDLRVAATAIRLARRTLATIRVNLFWAFAYNVAAIPLAAAGMLDPMVAGAAMACSSLFVVGNSLRLRRFR